MDDHDRTSGDQETPAAGEPPAAADPLDRAVSEVRALLESTVVARRARRARNAPVAEVEGEDEAIMAAAEHLAEQARHSVDLVLPATTPRMKVAHEGLGALAGSLEPTVEVRVVRAVRAPDPGARCQVRIAEVPLPTLLIADGRTALVCAESDGGRLTSVIQDTAVVGALHGLFGGIWASAPPVPRPLDFGNRARTEMVRRVLERLRDGVTDEAAARELAISVRTYRRYVTGILELLGAGSRFQAGVRATELGILGDRRSGL